MIKSEIRKEISLYRNNLKDNCFNDMNLEIYTKIISEEFLNIISNRPIFMYASYHHEVDTFNIAEFFLKKGNVIAYPKVLNKNREMSFFQIDSIDDLEKGYRGILEPKSQKCVDDLSKDAVMIVPMVAFDENLNRVGYGGGYYDTYLEKYPPFIKIGIAFFEQCYIIDNVEKNDIKMDYIITDKLIYSLKGERHE